WKRPRGRHFGGYLPRRRVDSSSHAAIRLAVHGRAVAGAGPFSEDRKGPVAIAAIVRPVDQPSRLLGLWRDRTGYDDRLRPGARGVGFGRGAPLDPRGVEKAATGFGRFPGCPVCQSFRLQTGAVPIHASSPPERRYAAYRRVAARGL